MSRSDDLLRAIESAYAAGLDATLWPQALAAITRTIGGVGTTIEIVDRKTLAHQQFHAFGIAPADQLAYVDHYAALNPRFASGFKLTPGEIHLDYDVIDEREMDRSPFYSEFLARQDLRYAVAGIIDTGKHEFGAVAVQRSARHGHAGRVEIELMQRLLPHVGQASDLTRRLADAGRAQSSLERALDWLSEGVALVRADGAIVYANEAFQATARRNDGLAVRKAWIEFAGADARDRFAAALAVVNRLRGRDSRGAAADFPVHRPSGAPTYLISVRPLLDSGCENGVEGAVAIVFVRDPSSHNAAALRMLRGVFGLTEAEASLAQALQGGVALDAYARERAVSLNTIYTHLRRIKEKTGCRRMAELIRRLNDLQVPLRLD